MAETQFKHDAEKKVEAIKQTIANQLSVIGLLKSFYAGSLDVQQAEFKTFSASILEDHPDIKLLAWIPRVRAEERGVHEADGKEMGFPQYQIREYGQGGFVSAARREQYFPLLFIEPREKYQELLGFDVGSLPGHLAAMRSAETVPGPAIAYANLPMLNKGLASVIYIYEAAQTEPTTSKSGPEPAGYSGFILGVYEVQAIIGKALELLHSTGVDIYLFDISDPQKPLSIIAFPSRIRVTPLHALDVPPGETLSTIYYRESIAVADRTWLAYCVPTDIYFQGKTRWGPLAAMFAGMLITGLIVAYLFLLTGALSRSKNLLPSGRTN